jgi:hypothetical protein
MGSLVADAPLSLTQDLKVRINVLELNRLFQRGHYISMSYLYRPRALSEGRAQGARHPRLGDVGMYRHLVLVHSGYYQLAMLTMSTRCQQYQQDHQKKITFGILLAGIKNRVFGSVALEVPKT